MHEMLEKLEKKVVKQLEPLIQKEDMSPSELDNAKKAVCLIKEIQEVKMGDAIERSQGYSETYRGSSYRRGRDVDTGRYMTRSYGGPYYDDPRDGWSRANEGSYERGYSGHSIKDRMVDNLERMMDDAKSEYERQTIASTIHRLNAEQ